MMNQRPRTLRQYLDPRYSFAARIALLSFALTFTSMVILSILAANIAKRRIESQVSQALLSMGREALGAGIRSQINERLADLTEIRAEVMLDEEARWSSVLAPYRVAKDASWIAVFDAEGNVRAAAGNTGRIPAPSARSWFIGARREPTLSWDPDSRGVVVAAPLGRASDRFQGVLAVAMDNGWAQRFVAERQMLLHAHYDAELAIVTQAGEIVAGADRIASLGMDKTRESVSRRTGSDGREYLVAVVPITGAPTDTLQWSLVLAERVDAAFAGAREVGRTIVTWGLLASLFIALINWLAASRSIIPLVQLAQIARLPDSKELFARITFSSRKDEIGVLANAWNAMLGRIAEHQGQLLQTNRDLAGALNERADTERRLKQSEEQYRLIFAAVTEGLVIFDRRGTIVAANPAACALHGREPNEVIGHQHSELIPQSERLAVERFFRDVEAGRTSYFESFAARKDGTRLHISLQAKLFELEGQPRVLAILRNIDEERRLARQVEQAARMDSLGRLSATIAHEINNVLMGIMPFTEIIRRRHHDDIMLKNAANHIGRSVDRGSRITQEILRFTRATEPVLEPFACGPWLSQMSDDLSALLGTGIRLSAGCADNEVMLYGDHRRLEQVIINLALNARDAMRGNGTLTVSAAPANLRTQQHFAGIEPADGFVHLSVTDTGPGMSPEIQQHIFEPLFTTKGSSGTGLGLAVVHQIILLHGGQIHVESAEGQGTTFHIVLPRSVSDTRSVQEGPYTPLSAKRVLLVEDDESVAAGLLALLDVEGFTTRHVALGADALAAVQNFQPDVLVLDIGLPDMSGAEVYRRINDSGARIPTVFSTGHGDEDAVARLPTDGRSTFLLKPYDFKRLRQAMEDVLGSEIAETEK